MTSRRSQMQIQWLASFKSTNLVCEQCPHRWWLLFQMALMERYPQVAVRRLSALTPMALRFVESKKAANRKLNRMKLKAPACLYMSTTISKSFCRWMESLPKKISRIVSLSRLLHEFQSTLLGQALWLTLIWETTVDSVCDLQSWARMKWS